MNIQSKAQYRCISKITALIEKEMKNKNICGLSIALVDDKETIWSKGFGHTDFSRTEKVTADTLFSLQSMTKCFTATTFLILVNKGLIGLDDPIRKHYPEFTVNTRFGSPEEEITKITFRRMLSHWSSFTHEAPLGNNYDTTPCSFEEHIESVSRSWLRSPVGSEHAYANIGVDLTGYVMGLVQNKSYENVMREELFSPLGILQATFDITEAQKLSLARGHNGSFKTPAIQVPMIPAGGLYASANEVAKFVSFHLRKGSNNEQQLIELELLDEMYRPQFNDSRHVGYGLGVYNFSPIQEVKVMTHGGGGYGYNTTMQWIPEYNIGVVMLVNDSKHSIPEKLTKKILELWHELQSQPEMISIPEEDLRKLEGTYCTYRRPMYNVVCEDGILHMYQTDGSELEIFAVNEVSFITRGETKINFNLDREGHPISFDADGSMVAFTAKYNDGKNDKQGPNNKEWQEVSGIYTLQADGRYQYLALKVVNGHLYLIKDDALKLHQVEDIIFFTADGEAVILEKDALLYKNIPAIKNELDFNKLIETIKMDEIKYDKHKGTVDLVSILNITRGFDQACNFIEKLIELDSEFKNHFSYLGKKLYGMGEIDNSLICFEKLLKLDADDKEAEEMKRKIELRKQL